MDPHVMYMSILQESLVVLIRFIQIMNLHMIFKKYIFEKSCFTPYTDIILPLFR